jgi:ankyrin repeat protein
MEIPDQNPLRRMIGRLNANARARIGRIQPKLALFVLMPTLALAVGDANSALLLAVRSSNTDAVKAELSRGADVNEPDQTGTTALMYSTYYGFAKMEIVLALLRNGANVNAQDKNGLTALMLAAGGKGGSDSDKIVKALLDKGADPNLKTSQGRTALMEAIQPSLGKPRVEIVRALLLKRADPNTRISGGATVLMVASRDGDSAIVKALLEYGADAQAGDWEADAEGSSWCSGSLEWAEGHPDILKMLSDKGATSKPRCKPVSRHRSL